MARKNFLKQAQQSIVDSQTLIVEEPIQEDYIVGSKRSEYEGTTRLKGARNIPLNKIKPDCTGNSAIWRPSAGNI